MVALGGGAEVAKRAERGAVSGAAAEAGSGCKDGVEEWEGGGGVGKFGVEVGGLLPDLVSLEVGGIIHGCGEVGVRLTLHVLGGMGPFGLSCCHKGDFHVDLQEAYQDVGSGLLLRACDPEKILDPLVFTFFFQRPMGQISTLTGSLGTAHFVNLG